MSQERLVWKGQKAEALQLQKEREAEAATLIRDLRNDLNPISGIYKIDRDAVLRRAGRLAAIQIELEMIRKELRELNDLLGET